MASSQPEFALRKNKGVKCQVHEMIMLPAKYAASLSSFPLTESQAHSAYYILCQTTKVKRTCLIPASL